MQENLRLLHPALGCPRGRVTRHPSPLPSETIDDPHLSGSHLCPQFPVQSLAHGRYSINACWLTGWMRPWSPQPGGAAPLPPILGAQFLDSSHLSDSFSLNFHFEASPVPGSSPCVPGIGRLHVRKGRGEALAGGGGSRSGPRCQLLLYLGPCPGRTCAPGIGLLGARVSAQPGAPSWAAYKASSKFSPWFKPGRFTGPQVLWPGCQSPKGNGVSSLPASSLSAQGQRGLLQEGEDSSPLFSFIHWFH